MDLLILVLVLSLLGFIVWLVTTKIPMDPSLRIVIQLIALVVIVIYLLGRLNLLPNVL